MTRIKLDNLRETMPRPEGYKPRAPIDRRPMGKNELETELLRRQLQHRRICPDCGD